MVYAAHSKLTNDIGAVSNSDNPEIVKSSK